MLSEADALAATGRLAIGKLADVKTILLVDDEYSIVEVLAHLLEEEGYFEELLQAVRRVFPQGGE